MNWYRKINKQSDQALPGVDTIPGRDYDTCGREGINELDLALTEEDAQGQDKLHPDLNYLGAGNYGVAYETSPDQPVVVKYTRDYDEYENARAILLVQENIGGGTVPGVVHVFKAEKVNEEIDKIWLEKVSLVPRNEVNIINKMGPNRIKSMVEQEMSEDYVLIALSSEGLKDVRSPEFVQVYQKLHRFIEKLNENFQHYDLHSGNIGIDSDGEYLLLDIGHARLQYEKVHPQ